MSEKEQNVNVEDVKQEETDTRISITEFSKFVKAKKFSHLLRKTIPMSEVRLICEQVIDSCFNGVSFLGYLRDITSKLFILLAYCDVKYEENLDDFADFIYHKDDLVDDIFTNISQSQVNMVYRTIDEMISFQKAKILKAYERDYETIALIENVNDCVTLVKDSLEKISKFTNNVESDEVVGIIKKELPRLIDTLKTLDVEKVTSMVLKIMDENNNKKT